MIIKIIEDITHIVSIGRLGDRARILLGKKVQKILTNHGIYIRNGDTVELILCVDDEGFLDLLILYDDKKQLKE